MRPDRWEKYIAGDTPTIWIGNRNYRTVIQTHLVHSTPKAKIHDVLLTISMHRHLWGPQYKLASWAARFFLVLISAYFVVLVAFLNNTILFIG